MQKSATSEFNDTSLEFKSPEYKNTSMINNSLSESILLNSFPPNLQATIDKSTSQPSSCKLNDEITASEKHNVKNVSVIKTKPNAEDNTIGKPKSDYIKCLIENNELDLCLQLLNTMKVSYVDLIYRYHINKEFLDDLFGELIFPVQKLPERVSKNIPPKIIKKTELGKEHVIEKDYDIENYPNRIKNENLAQKNSINRGNDIINIDQDRGNDHVDNTNITSNIINDNIKNKVDHLPNIVPTTLSSNNGDYTTNMHKKRRNVFFSRPKWADDLILKVSSSEEETDGEYEEEENVVEVAKEDEGKKKEELKTFTPEDNQRSSSMSITMELSRIMMRFKADFMKLQAKINKGELDTSAINKELFEQKKKDFVNHTTKLFDNLIIKVDSDRKNKLKLVEEMSLKKAKTTSFTTDTRENNNLNATRERLHDLRNNTKAKDISKAYITNLIDKNTQMQNSGRPVHNEGLDGNLQDNVKATYAAMNNVTGNTKNRVAKIETGKNVYNKQVRKLKMNKKGLNLSAENNNTARYTDDIQIARENVIQSNLTLSSNQNIENANKDLNILNATQNKKLSKPLLSKYSFPTHNILAPDLNQGPGSRPKVVYNDTEDTAKKANFNELVNETIIAQVDFKVRKLKKYYKFG